MLQAMNVGLVGLGLMGRPIVRRLLAAGHTVRVHNRSRGPVAELVAEGAIDAGSAAGVAQGSDAVLTALPTVEAVREIYSAMTAHARAGQLFADHSTVDRETSLHCHRLLAERGAAFLDAPVSGGPGGVEAGTLTIMVGGDEAAFEAMLPVFRAYGGTIRRCGPEGAGTVVKLVNQLLVAVHTLAAAEATAFGERLGADPEILREMIGPSFGGSTMLNRNLPRFAAQDFTPATPVRLLLKDLGIVTAAAAETGAPITLGRLAQDAFTRVPDPMEDIAVIIKVVDPARG